MTTRPIIRGILATLLATGLAAAPSPAAPRNAQQDAQNRQLPVPTTATVSVDQLGPDSTIAVVTRGRLEQRGADGLARSLEVITPDGVRHPVYTVELEESPADWFVGDFSITDWRPELHTALLKVSLGPDGDALVSYDVTTGVTHQVLAPRRGSFFALDPDGSGVLMTTYPRQRRPGRVVQVAWDGTRTRLPARAGDGAITSIDGRTLVTDSTRRAWWVTDLGAGTSAAIDTPGRCVPQRWLDADTVVATCGTARWSQLRAVDLDGRSTRLGVRHTAASRRSGPDVFNDDDVRVVRGRSWYESYGGCGGAFLTRQTEDGQVRLVRIPGREGALTLVGVRGDRLLVAHHSDECESRRTRSVLTLLDPVARREVELTRLDRDESWREVVPAGEVRAWIW